VNFMKTYRVIHATRYSYQFEVSQCLSEARITPRPLPSQRVLETSVAIRPEAANQQSRVDYFGNAVTSFSLFEPHARLEVVADSVVEIEDAHPQGAEAEWPSIAWEEAARRIEAPSDEAAIEASEFLYDSPYVAAAPKLAAYAAISLTPGRPLAEAARDLSARIHSGFQYKPKATSIDMPLLDVFDLRRGVCQDFAHIMIGALRSSGLAARYVSGYLRSGANLQGSEASHAWVSVYIPGYGWLDLDPTNNVVPSTGHVTVAWGRDFGDVTPVKGVALGGGKHTIKVEVSVRPV
jgi:transglutaminase-like putative cysteine protease